MERSGPLGLSGDYVKVEELLLIKLVDNTDNKYYASFFFIFLSFFFFFFNL